MAAPVLVVLELLRVVPIGECPAFPTPSFLFQPCFAYLSSMREASSYELFTPGQDAGRGVTWLGLDTSLRSARRGRRVPSLLS